VLGESCSVFDLYAGRGDRGINNPDWGQTFISPAYVMRDMLPGWRPVSFTPRRSECKQDV
jgi:hypothetical protein